MIACGRPALKRARAAPAGGGSWLSVPLRAPLPVTAPLVLAFARYPFRAGSRGKPIPSRRRRSRVADEGLAPRADARAVPNLPRNALANRGPWLAIPPDLRLVGHTGAGREMF